MFAIRSSISSGYDVTTDYHGLDVPPGTLVTATATSTDTAVTGVTFIWKDPDDNGLRRVTKTTDEDPDPSINVYTDSFTSNIEGVWIVQAIFHGPHRKPVPGLLFEDKVSIKAISFFVIPESLIAGTAGTLFSMIAGLRYFARRKKK